MNSYKTTTMEYLHSRLNFFIDTSLSLNNIFDFFSTHFLIKHNQISEDVIANIYVTRNNSLFSHVDFNQGEDIYIRKSASDFFTIPCKRVTINGIEYLKCTKTETMIAFDSINKKINVFTHSTESEQDELVFIEFIRDLVLKNEENHGVIVLHATSAYKDGNVSLIIGPKGAGKSTTLLEFINKFNYKFMSGDKTFLWMEDGKLLAAGWPDYPHLGLGTLSKYPKFVEGFGLAEQIEAAKKDLWSTDHKIAVNPKLFKEIIHFTNPGLVSPVGCMIYPNLYPSKECYIKQEAEHTDLILPHVERIFTNDNKMWNHFIQPKNQEEYKKMHDNCFKIANKVTAWTIEGSGVLEKDLFSFDREVMQ